ncbi:MAG: PAS domain-containing protein, partial [Oceanospirillaceae bacterium]|nr:PAS domain-containing protein [Oceanospirillaceae bacterium]
MQKWGVNEDSLPANSGVINRPNVSIPLQSALTIFLTLLGVIGVLTSITIYIIRNRKSLAEANKSLELKSSQLAEQSHRLELVLEGTALGIWDWNPKTSDVVFDERWCQMLGYELSEIAPNVESWSSRVHPDDIESCFSDITAHIEGRTERY